MTQEIRPKRGTPLVLMLAMAIVITAVAAAGGYYVFVQKPLQAQLTAQQNLLIQLTGLQNPVRNKLDAQFEDKDGDLVADPPTDPAKQIDPPTLVFSYVAVEESDGSQAGLKDLMAAISKATGKPVQYLDVKNTDDQLRALKEGRLHVTALNTGKVPVAVCAAGFVPLFDLGDDKGKSTYEMEILVRADLPIQTVADLKGHELTLTEPGSNSGFKAPLVSLKDAGLLPGRDFGIRYSQGHTESIKGLAAGTYEAIAIANDVLRREIAAGTIKPTQFRSIYRSESFPTAAIGYVYNLKPELAAKIKQTLADFDWKGTSLEKYFATSNQTHFVPVNYKNDWALIRRIDDSIGTVYEVK